MDFLKPQRKIPRPRLGINVGHFRQAPKHHTDSPPDGPDLHTFYSAHNQYLPIDTVQKTINQHHFNQQVQLALPVAADQAGSGADSFLTEFNQQLYSVLQETHVYHVQCDLGLLFTEPFASTYFPSLRPRCPTKGKAAVAAKPTTPSPSPSTFQYPSGSVSLYATSTHTTLSQNSFSIADSTIFFNLDKDSYQALGFAAPHTIVNGLYRTAIPINTLNIQRLRTRLMNPQVNLTSFVLFAQDNCTVAPIDFSLLFAAYNTHRQLTNAATAKMGSIPMPLNIAPKVTLPIPVGSSASIGPAVHPVPSDPSHQQQPQQDQQQDPSTGSMNDEPLPLVPATSGAPHLDYQSSSGLIFSQPLNTDPSVTPQSILSIKRLKFRVQKTATQFSPIPFSSSTTPTLVSGSNTASNLSSQFQSQPQPQPTAVKSLSSQSLMGLMGTAAPTTSTSSHLYRATSQLFPRIRRAVILKFISSFYSHSRRTAASKGEEPHLANLQDRLNAEVRLVRGAKDKAAQQAKKAIAQAASAIRANSMGDDSDGTSDSDDGNSEMARNPKYASHFVQRVRAKTQSAPFSPTEVYQVVAQQLQLFIGLVYTHNFNYIVHSEQQFAKEQASSQAKGAPVEGKFSYLDLAPTSAGSAAASSSSTGFTTISIRGIIPPCIIAHIVKHLRAWVCSNSTDTGTNDHNYCFLTAYGIPSAVTNFANRFHGDSCGLGGTGESNYTIMLTREDSKPNQTLNDAFVLLRNVDHQAKEF